jgi:hypothetical protein
MTWSRETSASSGTYSVYYREIVSDVIYPIQRPLMETSIEKPIIVADKVGTSESGFIIYEDYHLGGSAGEIYMIKTTLPIVPEFPSLLVMSPLFMMATLLTAILWKRKRSTPKAQQQPRARRTKDSSAQTTNNSHKFC